MSEEKEVKEVAVAIPVPEAEAVPATTSNPPGTWIKPAPIVRTQDLP